ncbi:MAG: glucose-6-phosphate isomerase family protein [Beutenbergiaceae bacterium]
MHELEGVYQDTAAFSALSAQRGQDLAYAVEENRAGDQPGALIIGMSALMPLRIGAEFAITRGHLHRRADCAELYYCVDGHGLLLMDDLHGRTSIAELHPGEGVHVPGGWVHRSVNIGNSPFVTLFSYDAHAGQNYQIIERAGGMRRLVVVDGEGWTAVDNPDHTGYELAATP